MNKNWVFINIPFDTQYEPLFLALICGLTALRFTPRCALEVQGNKNRLKRIYGLMRKCKYSLHDLSRVELSEGGKRVPRFNMPFEAGLAVAISLNDSGHYFRILEAKAYRLQQTLSDLNEQDPFIHHGTPDGVLRALANIFTRTGKLQPKISDLKNIFKEMRSFCKSYKKDNGVKSIFDAKAFQDLVIAAKASSIKHLGTM